MPKGSVFTDEPMTYLDPYSGCRIRRLTNYTGHSNHLYFTDPCFLDDGASFVFTSDRDGHSNLFRYDLEDGTATQLTDLEGHSIENERVFDDRPAGAYSIANGKHYYWWQNGLYELDVHTLDERLVWRAPADKVVGIHGATTADGRFVCTMLRERVEPVEPRLEYPYSYFPDLLEARPLTQVIRVEVATGVMDVLHEDARFMTHVNVSPTRPNLLTFCHEGHWQQVEQRIWGLDIDTGAVWKIRPQDDGELVIGHEYWFADGEHVGYHGRPRHGEGDHVFGYRRFDNTDAVETRFPFHSWHFASNDHRLIVGDGTAALQSPKEPFIQLFRWDGTDYVGPKVVAAHHDTFNGQLVHCHPRFTPDGRHVLYTSDATGYANMYLAELKPFDELPDLVPGMLR